MTHCTKEGIELKVVVVAVASSAVNFVISISIFERAREERPDLSEAAAAKLPLPLIGSRSHCAPGIERPQLQPTSCLRRHTAAGAWPILYAVNVAVVVVAVAAVAASAAHFLIV